MVVKTLIKMYESIKIRVKSNINQFLFYQMQHFNLLGKKKCFFFFYCTIIYFIKHICIYVHTTILLTSTVCALYIFNANICICVRVHLCVCMDQSGIEHKLYTHNIAYRNKLFL